VAHLLKLRQQPLGATPWRCEGRATLKGHHAALYCHNRTEEIASIEIEALAALEQQHAATARMAMETKKQADSPLRGVDLTKRDYFLSAPLK
jgi:hypothetical protein